MDEIHKTKVGKVSKFQVTILAPNNKSLGYVTNVKLMINPKDMTCFIMYLTFYLQDQNMIFETEDLVTQKDEFFLMK